jgi:hypothetical protein
MSENSKPDLHYTCPHCGQKAVIGAHFCQTKPEALSPARPQKAPKTGSLWVYTLAGIFLAVVLFWRWLGPGTLLVVGLGLLVYLLVRQPKDAGTYHDLVKMCGTEEVANRLIEAELKLSPQSSRKKAIRAAADRYKRDLSR